jgi:hypothetical protein
LNASDIDNYTWRLPTDQENKDFTGRPTNSFYNLHWWEQDAETAVNPSPYYGVAGGEFPVRSLSPVSPLIFLPAAGIRTSGTIAGQLTSGFFWSNETASLQYAYGLSFNSMQLNPSNGSHGLSNGYAARCVYDPYILP